MNTNDLLTAVYRALAATRTNPPPDNFRVPCSAYIRERAPGKIAKNNLAKILGSSIDAESGAHLCRDPLHKGKRLAGDGRRAAPAAPERRHVQGRLQGLSQGLWLNIMGIAE